MAVPKTISTADWDAGVLTINQRRGYVLESSQWTDCMFVVGSENQEIILGHKTFLAVGSPVFAAMFYGEMADKENKPIRIPDLQPKIFKAIIEYIYTEEVNISSFDMMLRLLYGAKKYMIDPLVKHCVRHLSAHLRPSNVCKAYEYARLLDETSFGDKCLQLISARTKEVLTRSSFLDAELSTVVTVFSLDLLNIDSELDLFDAAVRYAGAHFKKRTEWSFCPADRMACTENGQPSFIINDSNTLSNADDKETPKSPEPVEEAKTPTIRDAIEKIRFLTLTAKQFADGPARSTLLTESEALGVIINILSSDPDVPMPSGLSQSTVQRKSVAGQELNSMWARSILRGPLMDDARELIL